MEVIKQLFETSVCFIPSISLFLATLLIVAIKSENKTNIQVKKPWPKKQNQNKH